MRAKRYKKYGVRYPWKKWFAQGCFIIERGKDFDGLPHGMIQTARSAAKRAGLKLSIRITTSDEGNDQLKITVKNGVPVKSRRK